MRRTARMAGSAVLGVLAAVVALACLSWNAGSRSILVEAKAMRLHAQHRQEMSLVHDCKGQPEWACGLNMDEAYFGLSGQGALIAGTRATGGEVVGSLLKKQAMDGAFVGALVKGISRDVKHLGRDGNHVLEADDDADGKGELPSMRQIMQMRKVRRAERLREEEHYKKALGAQVIDCEGKSEEECFGGYDAETLQHVLKGSKPVDLLQLNRFKTSATELQRRLGGASAKAGSTRCAKC